MLTREGGGAVVPAGNLDAFVSVLGSKEPCDSVSGSAALRAPSLLMEEKCPIPPSCWFIFLVESWA